MSKKGNNVFIKNLCPRCKSLMEVRGHKRITEKLLKKAYYFEEWYYCQNCSYIQLFEDKKIITKRIKKDEIKKNKKKNISNGWGLF